MDRRGHIILVSIATAALLCGCGELDPNATADGPLYYSCDAPGDCASGFSCYPGVSSLGGLCLPLQGQCPAPLEMRVADPDTNPGTTACQLPFACPAEGGIVAAGDASPCPPGFACVDADGDPCGACAFVSCDMGALQSASATLAGIDAGGLSACFADAEAGDEAGFTDGTPARVFCRLDESRGDYVGCPAGWTASDTMPCQGDAGPYCYAVATVLDAWDGGPDTGGSGNRTMPVGPLFLTPSRRTLSCRPAP